MTWRYSTTIIADRLTQLNTDIGASAKIEIFTGSQPASVATGATGTLLVTLTGNASGFGSVSGGVLTASAITGANAVATGTAGWFRIFKSDGTTACCDGAVGTSGSDLNLNNTSITSGQAVSITSFTVTGEPV